MMRVWLIVAALGAVPAVVAAQDSTAGVVPVVDTAGRDTAGGRVERLTLAEAIRLAAEESEAVAIAEAGVLRARGQQAQARSEYFPQLTGTAGYTRTLESQFGGLADDSDPEGGPPAPAACERFTPNPANPLATRVDSLEAAVECLSTANPFGGFDDLPFGQANQYTLGLTLSQTLFAGGRVRARNRIAGAARESADINLVSERAQLVLDVAEAYYDAALSDRLYTIAQASLEQAERTLADTRLARQVGTMPEFDLLRAQVARDNLRPVVIQRAAARNIAYLRLKQLLDIPLGQELELTTDLSEGLNGEGAPVVDVIPASLRSDPDSGVTDRAPVRRAEAAVVVQEGQLDVAQAQSFPSLTLNSQFARIAFPDDGFPDAWNDFVSDWTIGVSLQIPIFTGGRLKGDRMVAHAALDEARHRLEQTRELAAIDAANTRATLEAAEATWAASAGTAQQAQRAYEIAEIRYREGISTQTELSDARLLLQQAQANRAQAARDLQVARIRMELLPHLPLPLPGGDTVPAAAPATPPAAPAPAPGGNGTGGGSRVVNTGFSRGAAQ